MRGNIGISPDYVKDWSIEEAIREIVQNYLDSKNEFGCDGYIEYRSEKGIGLVKDYGPGMKLKHFVMGISEKSEDSIGQFGEGLKLALLVFAREDRNIEVWSNGKKITPEINYNKEFETDMINLNIEDLPPHWAANHKGTSIKFECSEDELEAGKNYFLKYRKKNGDNFRWIDENFTSLPGGNVWVNGSKVGKVDNAYFSYHLSDKEAKDAINRDRGLVDRDELESIVKRKIWHTNSLKMMKEFFKIIKNQDGDFWESSFYFSGDLIKNISLWKRAKTEVFGKNFVLSSDINSDKQAEYKGYNVIKISWRVEELLKKLDVKTSTEMLKNEKSRSAKIAQKDLNKNELKNLKKAKKLIKDNYNNCGRVKVVTKFNNDNVEIQGQYNHEKDVILISRKCLKGLNKTIEVLLHECVHKHSGYSDCTAGYEQALVEIATDLMIK